MSDNGERRRTVAGVLKRMTVVAAAAFFLVGASVVGVLRLGEGRVGVAAASTVFSVAAPEGISDPGTVSEERNNVEVYRAAAPGVVLISTSGEQRDFWDEPTEQGGTGSGVVVDRQGHILTNEHVVRSARRLAPRRERHQPRRDLLQIRHGLLTYALLEGMASREADRDGNRQLWEREWLDCAVEQVPPLQMEAIRHRRREIEQTGRGAELIYVEGADRRANPEDRVQTPRVFYRPEASHSPLII